MMRCPRAVSAVGAAAVLVLGAGVAMASPVSAGEPPSLGAPTSPSAASGIQTYFGNLGGFDAASGAPVQVTFDDVAAGTDLEGSKLAGATFSAGPMGGAPPIVVRAADTVTPSGFTGTVPFDPAQNTLVATSGANVLSPGGPVLAPGPDPTVESDDLVVSFDQPVSAVGFDLLLQSLDDYSGVAMLLYDSAGRSLYVNSLIPTGSQPAGSPGGSMFVGFVSPTPNIALLVIDETDDNEIWPDSNIGIDSLRFGTRPPVVVPGGATVSEGDAGTTSLQVPVTLSRASAQPVTVDWSTRFDASWGPQAAVPGVDYLAASGSVTFAPGQTAASVPVSVLGDTKVEADELLVVGFSNATNATMGGYWGLGFGAIANDDALPVVVPGGATVVEGDAGTSVLEVPVTLSKPSDQVVTVEWSTRFDPSWGPQAAAPGVDYLAATGTVTFAPGETTASASVTILGDTDVELDELLVVGFANPVNARMGGYWGLGFGGVADDDQAP